MSKGLHISLTDFVDIVSASGTPKATKVLSVINRPPYEPVFDFYKLLREAIVLTHSSKGDKADLKVNVGAISDPKKRKIYPVLLRAYLRWWGRKSITWFSPPNRTFTRQEVSISVNPELGLRVNGVPHLIKLYFKSERLAKLRVAVITHLMTEVLAAESPRNTVMAVLDVRSARLVSPTTSARNLSVALQGELAYIEALNDASSK